MLDVPESKPLGHDDSESETFTSNANLQTHNDRLPFIFILSVITIIWSWATQIVLNSLICKLYPKLCCKYWTLKAISTKDSIYDYTIKLSKVGVFFLQISPWCCNTYTLSMCCLGNNFLACDSSWRSCDELNLYLWEMYSSSRYKNMGHCYTESWYVSAKYMDLVCFLFGEILNLDSNLTILHKDNLIQREEISGRGIL